MIRISYTVILLHPGREVTAPLTNFYSRLDPATSEDPDGPDAATHTRFTVLYTPVKLFLWRDSSPNFNPNIWKLLIQKPYPLATFISHTSRRSAHINTHKHTLKKTPSVWQQQTNTQVVESIMDAQQDAGVPILRCAIFDV